MGRKLGSPMCKNFSIDIAMRQRTNPFFFVNLCSTVLILISVELSLALGHTVDRPELYSRRKWKIKEMFFNSKMGKKNHFNLSISYA